MDELTGTRRRSALLDLVELRLPLRAAVAGLSAFPWDSDVELVHLRRAHLVGVLEAHRCGTLDAAAVEAWAEALECRDDVRIDDEELREAMYQLSTPELFDQVDVAAPRWLRRLRG